MGTSSQVISLPKGGGALRGIGEKFSPDPHTGTGNFTVPIALPPGRNGFQPQLSLGYSTGQGNGPFGLGWSLSVPGVSRQTSKGVPRYDDSDTFVLSGTEDLVPIPGGSPGTTRYQPRTEALFAHIEHHRDDAGSSYWKVRTKDGLVGTYGTPRPPDALEWRDPAVIADPARPRRIFAWKLTRTTDPLGNCIEYEYDHDTGENGPHYWDQLYLKQIRYADYTDQQGEHRFLVSVRFEYGKEERPDSFSEYRPGFEVRTRRRCERIEVRTHAETEHLLRTYHLVYLDQRAGKEHLHPSNGVSLLSQVRVEGHDGPRTEVLPPLEFGYTRFDPEGRDFSPIHGPDRPPGSLARPEYELADLLGNGLPDVLEMNGTVRYWRNLGGGRFDRPREMRDAPAGLRLADPGVQMLDADGDGRIDLLVSTETLSGYFSLRFGGFWDRRSFQPYRLAPSFDLKDPEVRLVDLDGDGVTDALRSGSRLECFFNDPKAGWNETRRVERRALDEFPNISFSDPRVKLADLTGDGLQDIVLVYDGCVEYWPSLGRGDWGKRVSMARSPRFSFGYDPKRILLGDVDGDGLADMVYVEDTSVTLWLNQSGNRWSDPIEIQGTPPVSNGDAVALVDLLGTGVAGVLWSADANRLARANMAFLDFTGGTKPYLLNEMDNHLGAVTRVEYAPSTRFYLKDEGRPETRWRPPLPFPVQVVARVEASDAVAGGKLTTEYRYHHGYWDGVEREFRGFGMVEQLDTELFEDYGRSGPPPGQDLSSVLPPHFSPPLLKKTWFHQGAVGDERGEWQEMDYRGEYWSGDAQLLDHEQAVNAFLSSFPPTSASRRAKRDALRSLRGSILRTELYALDGSPREERPFTVSEFAYGLCLVVMIDGETRLLDRLGPDDLRDEPHGERRLRIFFPHPRAERITQWERGDDPMTQLAFTGDYDSYGQPRSQTAIAVPRGRDFRSPAPPGEPYLATHTVTAYAQRDDAQRYLADRVARTTTSEILDDGSPTVFALQAAILDGSAPRRVVGQTLQFYDGVAYEGLPFGELGDYGVLSRSESLVLTEDVLREAYASGGSSGDTAEAPPYLAPGGPPAWTADYPPEFRDLLPPLAGYTFQPGGAGSPHAAGYFAAVEQRRYDCQDDPDGRGRGLLKATRDPLGRDTTIRYDTYDLLPAEVTDPCGLTISAVYDYRVLQPRELTDANGNRTAYAFTPSGLLASTAVMGRPGEDVGDTSAVPGTRLVYDFMAFAERGQPISVRTVRRVHHANDANVPRPERDETVETVEYSDGFGRLLQTRAQADEITFGDPVAGDAGLPADQASPPGAAVGQRRAAGDEPRVIVSGWRTYDHKGRVVEKYEPFFSTGWAYAPPTEAQLGQKATLYYDPRSQAIRTVSPDGSEQRVVYGVPPDLGDPDEFAPTPWEAYTYDANDNAGRTHPATSTAYQHHWDTPASLVVDALGRTVAATTRNGPNPETDWYVTRSTYDIRGNLLAATDALGRPALRSVYDLAGRVLRSDSIDAGRRRAVFDAAGNAIEERDGKGALVLRASDALNRPLRLWARDGSGQPLTLRERLVYGDSPDVGVTSAEARAANLLGQLHQHYDEAGLLAVHAYDFKGNVLEKTRRVVADTRILSVFELAAAGDWQVRAFRVDWQPSDGTSLEQRLGELLEPTEYRTSISYDALNRIKALRYPEDVDGRRQELCPRYNQAGALERVELDGTAYVERIAYNAKGQRTLIVYGNGVMTRYAYDPRTFRLARLHSNRYTAPAALTFRPTGPPLQDFAYEYDLAGNVTTIRDRAPGSGIPSSPLGADELDRTFGYDPLYRLLSASGRECDVPQPPPPWTDLPRCVDPTQARGYAERYQYDPVGNVTRWQHQANGGSFTRQLALIPDNNRLVSVTVGAEVYDYDYDASGNLVRETFSRHFEWDHVDRMRAYRTQANNAEPSLYAHYLYDASGQRVKKLVRKQGGQVEVTVDVDGIFQHQRIRRGSALQENNTLHVTDDQQRIGLIRVGTPFSDDPTPAVKYHLGDHLGGSNLVVDATGAWVNREEYTPYGETSFGSFARKRYRFSAKERDEESGLYYHGARYYAPWLARWVSCDPAGTVDGLNLYHFVRGNPLRLVDGTGTQSEAADAVAELERLLTSVSSSSSVQAVDKALQTLQPAVSGTDLPIDAVRQFGEQNPGFFKQLAGDVAGAYDELARLQAEASTVFQTHQGILHPTYRSELSTADQAIARRFDEVVKQGRALFKSAGEAATYAAGVGESISRPTTVKSPTGTKPTGFGVALAGAVLVLSVYSLNESVKAGDPVGIIADSLGLVSASADIGAVLLGGAAGGTLGTVGTATGGAAFVIGLWWAVADPATKEVVRKNPAILAVPATAALGAPATSMSVGGGFKVKYPLAQPRRK
ncbi:MAG: VCBS repeat-containing protein [Chloroflexi bacterium]|nr:VCBS repeat-containing protein [Chloroflexota bacterium]